ncbi:MAG: hypothetical protein KatS3mg103_0952 [Phycisphaerales bacterium]|nr:MAG: hypothetical protein KatS3mg103_0952 [Phycisphaerales bacterium]
MSRPSQASQPTSPAAGGPGPGTAGAKRAHDRPIELTSPLTDLPGVGYRRARQLASLGLTNVGKLIAHLPARHEWHEPTRPIDQLREGEQGSAIGRVHATRLAGRYPRQRFEAQLVDASGALEVVWFNGAYLRRQIQPGLTLRVRGRLTRYRGRLRMTNPAFDVLGDDHAAAGGEPQQAGGSGGGQDAVVPSADDRRLVAVYPAGAGLRSGAIAQAIESAIACGALERIEDHLPEAYRRQRALPALREAYRMQHLPADEDELAVSRRRLAYDELLMLQLGVQMRRAQLRRAGRAHALRWDEAVHERILGRLPYRPTPGQLAAMRELAEDLTRTTPANRLIQGDVGSGKTMVAAYAMLMAVATGHQSVLMAPTEVLAEQHGRSLVKILERAQVRVAMLTGALPAPERRRVLADLRLGRADIVVGTHALLTESVRFKSLALAIIDEQHRFGVHQRAALRDKADQRVPHTLVMTATPIPRTIAISVLGDLDVTTIADMPPGRHPVRTEHLPVERRMEAYQRLREHVERGGLGFVVAPAIGGQARQLELGDQAHEPTPDHAEPPADQAQGRLRRRPGAAHRRRRAARGAASRAVARPGDRPAARADAHEGARGGARALPPGSHQGVGGHPDHRRSGRGRARRHVHGSSSKPIDSGWPSCTSCAAGSAGAACPRG